MGRVQENKTWPRHPEMLGSETGVANVPLYPLHMIMAALGRSVVDYWSLDTEGSELDILENTDFSKLEIGIITVEHAGDIEKRSQIRSFMRQRGYLAIEAIHNDDLFASPDFLKKRGLMPDELRRSLWFWRCHFHQRGFPVSRNPREL